MTEKEPLVRTPRRSLLCQQLLSPLQCVAATAAVSGACFGYEIGVIDTILSMSSFRLFFKTGRLSTTGEGEDVVPIEDAAGVEGTIVSTFLIGCCLGSVLSSYTADRYGRKSVLLLGALLFTTGGVLQSLALGLGMLYLGRGVSGVGVGCLSMVAPLYISEASVKEVRGTLIATQQLLITVGIFTASCVNSLLYTYGRGWGDAQWRVALAFQIAPCLLLLGALTGVPSSPRWLVMVGRGVEARGVVAGLRGLPHDHPSVTEELRGIIGELVSEGVVGGEGERLVVRQPHTAPQSDGAPAAVAAAASGDPGGSSSSSSPLVFPPPPPPITFLSWGKKLVGLFAPGSRKRTLVVMALQFFQQFSGINAILYFAASLFVRAGVAQDTASTTLVIANAGVLVIGTLPGMYLVDRDMFGRRPLLLWGAFGMALCHGLVAVLVALAEGATPGTPSATALPYTAIASMMAFTFVFSSTWGPVVWVVCSEVFSLEQRAMGTALGTLVNWVCNALIGKLSPLMTTAWKGWSFFVFSGFCLAGGVWTWLCLRETQGVPLEDMARVFHEEGGGKGVEGGRDEGGGVKGVVDQ